MHSSPEVNLPSTSQGQLKAKESWRGNRVVLEGHQQGIPFHFASVMAGRDRYGRRGKSVQLRLAPIED